MPEWGVQGLKVGACEGLNEVSACLLQNGQGIVQLLSENMAAYDKMIGAKYGLHHYTQYMEIGDIRERAESLRRSISGYENIDGKMSISE